MFTPFIRNHQYNHIKKQVGILQNAIKTVADLRVIEAVRYSTECKVVEAFPDMTDLEKQSLQKFSVLDKAEEFRQYLHSLEPYIVEFPQVSEKQVKELFPKNKKLTLPDLSEIDYRRLTYLSWLDISMNKWFMVYNLNENVIGIEGKCTPANKKDICSLCNSYGEVALVTAVSKLRPVHASPDYYKAVGNYMCTNSHECNRNITDVTNLEKFIHNIIG